MLAAKAFTIHLLPTFPRISRPLHGFTVGEGPLAAVSPPDHFALGTDSAFRLVAR